MPYISIVTAAKLSNEQKTAVKSEMGRLITILPGKAESGLMISFSDGHTMFYRGEEVAVCAFMEIRLYKNSPFEAKKELVNEIFKMMEKQLDIKNDQMSINIIELENWGSMGTLK